jgi:hypothetical protein
VHLCPGLVSGPEAAGYSQSRPKSGTRPAFASVTLPLSGFAVAPVLAVVT